MFRRIIKDKMKLIKWIWCGMGRFVISPHETSWRILARIWTREFYRGKSLSLCAWKIFSGVPLFTSIVWALSNNHPITKLVEASGGSTRSKLRVVQPYVVRFLRSQRIWTPLDAGIRTRGSDFEGKLFLDLLSGYLVALRSQPPQDPQILTWVRS